MVTNPASPPDGRSRFLGWDAALLAAVGVSLLVPVLGAIPLRRAEIYFADAARAMVESGDWLIPTYRGAAFFDKPVLTYWLMAGSFSQFGFSTAAARLPSVVAALAVMLVTLWLGRMLWSDREGLAGGLALAATPTFIMFGRIAMSDMLLTLWSTLTVALVVALYQAGREKWKIIALGVTLGLGFLTKGPIAWIMPGLGVACLVWSRRERRLPSASPSVLIVALLAGLAVAFGWFAAVYMRLGVEPLRYFFFKENLARFSGGAYNIGNPVWFYPQTYLHEGAPWSLFLPIAIGYLMWREPDKECRWLVAWILLEVCLLSVSRGKLGYYLLPLYPAISLIIGRYFLTAVWGRLAKSFAAVSFIVGAAILGSLLWVILRLAPEWRPAGGALTAVIVTLAAAGLACLVAALRPRPMRTLAVVSAVTVVTFALAETVVQPAFYEAQPNRTLLETAVRERQRRPDLRIAAREDPIVVSRQLLFDARMDLEEGGDLVKLASSSNPYLLIATPREAAALAEVPGVRKLAEYRYIPPTFFTMRGLRAGVNPDRLLLFANFPE